MENEELIKQVTEKAEKWLTPAYDAETQAEIKKMLANPDKTDLIEAFYKDLEFGTGGLRGIMGVGSNRMNIYTVGAATQGLSNYLNKNFKDLDQISVVVGHDCRNNSRLFAEISANIFSANGIKVYLFEDMRPTPEMSFAIRHFGCQSGINITASHNPREYNGYKLYDDKGCQLIPCLASQVIDKVNAIEDELAIDANCTDEQKKLITVIGKDVDEEYYKNVLSIQLNPEVKKDIKIVFSPEHGTANIPVQEVYKRAGYTCIPVVEQCSPDPDFSNTPTPNPEQAGAYELSLKYAKENQADLILVCDPDADRMGVGVLHNGEYVVLTGNQSGSVEIEYICSQLQKQGKMPENPVMFNTVVTSDLGEKVASDYGVTTEKTLTGFKFIGEKVAKYEKTHEKNYVFGYEESYGSLIKPFVRDKDAPQACLMLAEACAFYKEQGKDLVDVLDSLYDRHGTYEESQVALSLAGEAGAKRIKEILANLRKDAPTQIGGTKVVRSEDYKECVIKEGDKVTELTGFTKSDVLKYYLEDGSWIAVRPSGTEPKCKFYYCIKGASKEDAHNKTVHFQKAMDDLIAK